MRRHTTHNKCYGGFAAFGDAVRDFLCATAPGNRRRFRGEVADSFRIINPGSVSV